jgi:putative hydrolase of the HAD superfamily
MPETDKITDLNLRAVIFDMDNTLFDFVEAKQHACDRVAGFLGRNDGDALFKYFLHGPHGFEDHENIREYLVDREQFNEEVYSACLVIYEHEKLRVLAPYPMIHEILGKFRGKGLKMAVLTDAYNGNALLRLDRLDLTRFFEYVITTDMTGCKKPAREPFLLALRMLGTRPEETLLIGDSIRRDITPGKILGMITAHARYGDRNLPSCDHCVPDIVLESMRDFSALLSRIRLM